MVHLGLGPGERVAVVQQNRTEYVEVAIAIARAGGVLVPMLGALTEEEHAFMAQDAGARYILALGPETVPRALSAGATSGAAVLALGAADGATDLDALAEHEPAQPLEIDRAPSALAQILYTSGTTGQPKGVTHSYASAAAAMGAWVTTFSVRPEDRLLGHLALSHFGGRAMDTSWMAGATLVILPGPDPKAMLRAIVEQRITILLMIPTLLRMLLDHPDAAGTDLSTLRVVLYAAAPAAPSLVRRALERLGPALYTGFGQTEAYGLNTLLSPEEHEAALADGGARLTSVGRETEAFAQVRILSEDGANLRPGEVGEICVSAPWTTPGFWNRPDLDHRRLRNGWLRTGDLGRSDENGYIYLADRTEDKIISGGFNVYPAEVEGALAGHPAVAECAVFAVPDEKWGEAIRAAVMLRPGAKATPGALIAFSKEHLARFKVPKVIEIMPELPKTAVGKILRRALREPYWKGRDREVHGAE